MVWKTASHSLEFAVTVGDKTVSSIRLREPDVDALEAIDELGIEPEKAVRVRQLRGMIEALSDAPSEVIGKLHRNDLTAIGELLAPLLADAEPEAAEAS